MHLHTFKPGDRVIYQVTMTTGPLGKPRHGEVRSNRSCLSTVGFYYEVKFDDGTVRSITEAIYLRPGVPRALAPACAWVVSGFEPTWLVLNSWVVRFRGRLSDSYVCSTARDVLKSRGRTMALTSACLAVSRPARGTRRCGVSL